jgi:hypothetical protein
MVQVYAWMYATRRARERESKRYCVRERDTGAFTTLSKETSAPHFVSLKFKLH